MAFDGYEHLKLDLENTASWREEQAIRFPDDDRNTAAVTQLNHLISTVDNVPQDLMTAYAEFFDLMADSEKHQEMLRSIGFRETYADATDFVRHFIADRSGA
jgi:hypothetical protein